MSVATALARGCLEKFVNKWVGTFREALCVFVCEWIVIKLWMLIVYALSFVFVELIVALSWQQKVTMLKRGMIL